MSTVKVTTPSDREIAMTRVFDAPRELVYEAYTTPALLKRWLGVHRDWSLAVCEIDLRVGGAYRYVWRGDDGREMGMGGVYLEIVPGERLVTTERFDTSWYPGDAEATIVFAERKGRTTLTLTVKYESRDARDEVLRSPMKSGVEISFGNLAELLASTGARR